MKRIIEVEKDYTKYTGIKAIDHFFKSHENLSYWKENFIWMIENNVDFFSDDRMNDGTKNKDWTYALHLDNEDGHTYICIIERA